MRTLPPSTKNQAFLNAVRLRRREMKLPQKVLAHELSVSTPAYHKIETGKTILNFEIFNFLCKRLILNAEKFLLKN